MQMVDVLMEGGFKNCGKNKIGWTVLHMAADVGKADIINALLASNSALYTNFNVDEQDDTGNTPLHLAAANGHVAAVKSLVAAGADCLVKNQRDQVTHIHVLAHTHTHVCMYEHLYVCVSVYVSVRLYIYTYTHTHTYKHSYTHTYMRADRTEDGAQVQARGDCRLHPHEYFAKLAPSKP